MKKYLDKYLQKQKRPLYLRSQSKRKRSLQSSKGNYKVRNKSVATTLPTIQRTSFIEVHRKVRDGEYRLQRAYRHLIPTNKKIAVIAIDIKRDTDTNKLMFKRGH